MARNSAALISSTNTPAFQVMIRLILTTCLIYLWAPAGLAQVSDAEQFRAEIFLKLCAGNQGFQAQDLDSLHLAIIFSSGDSLYQQLAEDYSRIIRENTSLPFRGVPNSVRMQSLGTLDSLDWDKLDVLIALLKPTDQPDTLLARCAANAVLSMTTQQQLVQEGFSIGVEIPENRQPQIFFNIASLKDEGAVYKTEILRLVTETW